LFGKTCGKGAKNTLTKKGGKTLLLLKGRPVVLFGRRKKLRPSTGEDGSGTGMTGSGKIKKRGKRQKED